MSRKSPRCFAPISTVFHPAVRKITHTEKQAAFRYDWPSQPSSSDAPRTQECFQMIFNDPSDLVALLGQLSPFFTLQASTAKPFTVATNTSSQSQSSGSKSGAAPVAVKPKAKPKPKAPPKPRAKASAKPASQAGAAPAPATSASASQAIATSSVPPPPAYASTATASIAAPSSSAHPQQPLSTAVNLMTAELKRKLLAGCVPSTGEPPGSQGQAAKTNPGAVHVKEASCPAGQAAIPYHLAAPSSTFQSYPDPHQPAQPQPQPLLRPVEQAPSASRSLQRTPTVVDLITFSPLIPSHIANIDTEATHPATSVPSANPAPIAPARMLLGGSSDFTLEGVNAEYPVMLTDEAERELVKVKLEEEDLDVEPSHGCHQAKVAHGQHTLEGHVADSHAWAAFTKQPGFSSAMSMAMLYGHQIFDTSEDELRAVMGEVMYDERFANLCVRVADIASQSIPFNEELNASQYIDSAYASAESYPAESYPAYYGYTASYQYTEASHSLPPFTYEYNYLRGYDDEPDVYGHARKRVKVEDEETQVVEYDDLAEEEAGMVGGYAFQDEFPGVWG
ncbi:hypothetical protein IAT38_007887 [Cryptococcus sp. DSM 104549]